MGDIGRCFGEEVGGFAVRSQRPWQLVIAGNSLAKFRGKSAAKGTAVRGTVRGMDVQVLSAVLLYCHILVIQKSIQNC